MVTTAQVIAHRGASATHPENTVAAFRAAVDQGADWVELDVRRTADGRLAVHHDWALPDGRLLVETSAAELPEHVPQLDGALAACRPLGVNIEIKNWPADPDWDPNRRLADRVVELVAGRGDTGGVLVSSFDRGTIDRVREVAAGLPTAFLIGIPLEPVELERLAADGHRAIHPSDRFVTEEMVAAAHAVGLAVNVWTVDDERRMAELIGWGIDGIVTNVPAVARAVVDRSST